MQTSHTSLCHRQVHAPSLLQCSRPRVVRVRSQNQSTTTFTKSTQQQEPITEKEVMSMAYNEQMQKQMGWNNPYEVRLVMSTYTAFMAQ